MFLEPGSRLGASVPESTMTRLEIHPLSDNRVDDAAALLAARHRAQRLSEPGLDPAFEKPELARAQLADLLAGDNVTAFVSLADGAVTGYLVGSRRDDAVWGPNIWVEAAGYAVERPETIRDLYAAAAEGWAAAGRTVHHAIVPATDPAEVDAWFRLGFGHQHVHAIREAPAPGEVARPHERLEVRRAAREDIDALARLDLVLPEHQRLSPVFSRLPLETFEELRAEWVDSWDDPRFHAFVVQHDGRVVGSAVGCPLDVSSTHRGLTRVPDAGFLGFAAVFPEARGLGAGRALGEAVLAWAREEGYREVVTDWRMTNLLSSRAWPRLGFRPTFFRLQRTIS